MVHNGPKQMQTAQDAEAVIENEMLPAMGDELGDDIMNEGGRENAEMMSEPAPGDEEPEEGYPEMVRAKEEEMAGDDDAGSFAAREYGEAYLRLVVSVEGDKMSVMDASVVDGPLVEQPDLTGQMAYEVLIDGRRVAGEAFADLGVASSAVPPDDPSRGHHFAELKNFDFVVRIPRGEVTQEELGRVEVELVRPARTSELSEEIAPAPGVPFAQAAADRGVAPPKVVARLEGIDLNELPEKAAAAIRKGLY